MSALPVDANSIIPEVYNTCC